METSRNEIHEKSETAEEAKEEVRSSNIRRRWSRSKSAGTHLIIGEDFQKKAEAVIEVGKDSGQREPGRQTVRRRRTKAKGRKDAEEVIPPSASFTVIPCAKVSEREKDRGRM